MFSQRISTIMQGEKMLKAAPETSVSQAAQWMAGSRTGAVLVIENEMLTGIFTERDAVFRVIARGLDAQATKLADVMTPSPWTIGPELSYGHALQLMHRHGIRHLPVVENGRPVGIVSGRDALDPELEEFICEAQRRQGFEVSPPAATPGSRS